MNRIFNNKKAIAGGIFGATVVSAAFAIYEEIKYRRELKKFKVLSQMEEKLYKMIKRNDQ